MLLMCPLRIVSELQRSSSSSSTSLSCCLPLTLHLSLSASRLLASFGGRKSFIDFVTVGADWLLSTAIFCCFSLGLVSNSIQSSENSLPKCLQWHVLDYRSDVVQLSLSLCHLPSLSLFAVNLDMFVHVRSAFSVEPFITSQDILHVCQAVRKNSTFCI